MRVRIISFILFLIASPALPDLASAAHRQQTTYRNRLLPSDNALAEQQNTHTLNELMRASSRLKDTFKQRDPRKLRSCLGPHKIFVSLDSKSEPGFYGRDQIRFILGRLFQERETREFRSNIQDIEVFDKNRAVIRADWTYIVFHSDNEVTERLRFDFQKYNDSWTLSEIRSSRH